MTTDEFKPMAARMKAWWPGTVWSDAMIAVWFEELAPFEAGAVRDALQHLKRSHLSPFAPGIGQLLAELNPPQVGPSLTELLRICRAAASAHGANASTGVYPGSAYTEIGFRIGELAMGFAQREGLERLVAEEYAPGSFSRRDLQQDYDAYLAQAEAQGRLELDAARHAPQITPGGGVA